MVGVFQLSLQSWLPFREEVGSGAEGKGKVGLPGGS